MPYDVLILGAIGTRTVTPQRHNPLKRVAIVLGFTGKYITEYLNFHPERSGPTPFTFAIAGRSEKKLEAHLATTRHWALPVCTFTTFF